jgi:8-hydroxy-5-deazaflavin:NADPH oxidoreductase
VTASAKPILTVLGGTGQEGRALALRSVRAGYSVVIGSRDAAKADLAELRRCGTTNDTHIERAANDRTSLQSRQTLRWSRSDEINGHS